MFQARSDKTHASMSMELKNAFNLVGFKHQLQIYNGLLLSHYKSWNSVICSNMDGPGDSH